MAKCGQKGEKCHKRTKITILNILQENLVCGGGGGLRSNPESGNYL